MLIKFAVKDFIANKKYNNLSPETIDGYVLVMDMFHTYCTNHQIVNVQDVFPQTIKSFLIELQNEKGNNPTSRNNKLRVLKNFYNWLQTNEKLARNRMYARK